MDLMPVLLVNVVLLAMFAPTIGGAAWGPSSCRPRRSRWPPATTTS
jgi:hypothetical protein